MALDTKSTGRVFASDFAKDDPRRKKFQDSADKAHAQDMHEHQKSKYSSASRHQEKKGSTAPARQIFSTVGKIAKDRAKGGSDNRSAAVDAASRYQNTGLRFNEEAKEWQHRDTGKAATGEERAAQVRHYGAYTEKGRAGIGYSGKAPTKHEKGSDAYYGQEFGQSHARGSAWTEHQQKLDPTLDTKGLRSKWIEQRRAFDTAGSGDGGWPVIGINPPKKGPGHGKGINPNRPKKGKKIRDIRYEGAGKKKGKPRPDMPTPKPPAYVHPWDRDDWGAGDREKIGLAPLPKPPVGAPGGTPKPPVGGPGDRIYKPLPAPIRRPPIGGIKKPGFPGGTPKPKPDRGGMFRPGVGFPGGPPLPKGPGRRPPMRGRPPMFGGGRRPPMYGGRRPPMRGRPPMFGGGRRPPMFGGGRRPPMFGGGRRPPMFGGGRGIPKYGGWGSPGHNLPPMFRGGGWGRVKNRR